LSSRRFSRLARRLYTLVAEVTELTEKVDNALQVTEDVYLARIYAAALDLFRVRVVSAAVDRKLAIIRDTYAALYEEASSGRAALMELAVVVLIVVEIVLALVRR
jgi:Holliday junction resolvasome RuvABC endonuclease subunit